MSPASHRGLGGEQGRPTHSGARSHGEPQPRAVSSPAADTGAPAMAPTSPGLGEQPSAPGLTG